MATVSLNMDSIGANDISIITGTVREVAIICVRLTMPMAAPASRDARMPTAITAMKTSPSRSVSYPPVQITAEPNRQAAQI